MGEGDPATGRVAWFAPKRYGYGAGRPLRWQGWCALGMFVAGATVAAIALRAPARPVVIVVWTAIFAIICAGRTEGGWRWRWGDRG